MILSKLISLFLIQVLGVMLPGPDFFLVLRTSLRLGWPSALLSALGVSTGIAIYSGIIIFFLDYLNNQLELIIRYIGLLGGCYLAYMSYGVFHNISKKNNFSLNDFILGVRTKSLMLKCYFSGLFCNLSNPKVIIIYLSILPLFIVRSNSFVYHMLIISILVFTTLLWFSFVAIVMGNKKVRSIFMNQIVKLEICFGIVLGIFSAFLFYDFIKYILLS